MQTLSSFSFEQVHTLSLFSFEQVQILSLFSFEQEQVETQSLYRIRIPYITKLPGAKLPRSVCVRWLFVGHFRQWHGGMGLGLFG